MAKASGFNAADWIARNTRDGTDLSVEAQQAVAAFTTMWNSFEGTLRDSRASVAAFERAVARYQPDRVPEATAKTLRTCLAFWRFAIALRMDLVQTFEGLYFRPSDRRRHVEAVLAGTLTGPTDDTLAMMIIIYRLRNNLFHGLKTLEMLNDQVQNLTNASRCLGCHMGSHTFALRRSTAWDANQPLMRGPCP